MMRRRLALVALLAVFGLIVAACGDDTTETTAATTTTAAATTTTGAATTTTAGTTTTAAATTTTAAPIATKICQVTDFGGIDDQSFNQTAWAGAQQAQADLGVEIKYLESDDATDYAPNIQAFLDEGCDLIITVGFNLAADTAAAACANPDQLWAILDEGPAYYPGSAWADGDGNPLCDFSKVRAVQFQTDEAAFLAGYLAAGVTQTGTVATFGGIAYPTVTIFMDGFVKGVAYYNQVNGTDVVALGWDPATSEGIFVGNFESQDDGRAQGQGLFDEGADIILPVAGPVGLGTAAACADLGCLVVGVDADQYLTAPTYAAVWLTSIMKNMDVAVYNTVVNVLNLGVVGNAYLGTLSNGGVGLAPFHDNEGLVSAELSAAIEQLKADIIAADESTPGTQGDGLEIFLTPAGE